MPSIKMKEKTKAKTWAMKNSKERTNPLQLNFLMGSWTLTRSEVSAQIKRAYCNWVLLSVITSPILQTLCPKAPSIYHTRMITLLWRHRITWTLRGCRSKIFIRERVTIEANFWGAILTAIVIRKSSSWAPPRQVSRAIAQALSPMAASLKLLSHRTHHHCLRKTQVSSQKINTKARL